MEVKEFVKTILKEVTEAVSESTKDNNIARFHFMNDPTEGIDFDLAVVSKKEASGKVGAEVLGIGGKTEGSMSNESVNRIKFRVRTYLRNS